MDGDVICVFALLGCLDVPLQKVLRGDQTDTTTAPVTRLFVCQL